MSRQRVLAVLATGATAGVGSAVLRRSLWDVAITLATTLAVGLPTLVVGLVLQELFALRLHWLPHSGAGGGTSSSAATACATPSTPGCAERPGLVSPRVGTAP